MHNLESWLIFYQEKGPEIWNSFNQDKEENIWFEEEVLKMLKETWQHPLVNEYEILLEELKSMI